MKRRIGHKNGLKLFFLALFMFSAAAVFAEVKLPGVLGNYMVLQRDMPIKIWGWAYPGEKVTVTFGEQKIKKKANAKGEWLVKLPAMHSGNDLTMTIQGKNSIQLHHIAIGEVWLCSGQSNMEKPIGPRRGQHPVINYQLEIAAANYPGIRLFHVQRNTSGLPLDDVSAEWQPCSETSIRGFSSAAYFFGRELHKKLQVPVGLIESSWGGTRSEPWTPPCGFASVPELADYSAKIEEANQDYKDTLNKKLVNLEKWLKQTKKDLRQNKTVKAMPIMPAHALNSHRQPTGLFNAMIHPLLNFAIRGATWYQGESNRGDGFFYRKKMEALINGWRKAWNIGDFPFYFVQIAPFRYTNKNNAADSTKLPEIWSAQLTTLSVPNTGMVVTTDIADLYDIHPQNKQAVGKRLALWALAKTYKKGNLVCSGPLYTGMKITGDKILVRFDYAENGLVARDGEPLNWFEIAGADKNYAKAVAKIDGDRVIVKSDAVPNPRYVRFAWYELAVPNLTNKEGLPASPFSSELLEEEAK